MVNQPKRRIPDWTIHKLLTWATNYFQTHQIDSPRSTAEILLAYALRLRRIDLYTQYDQPLNIGELADFKALIKRRLNREPVAYIVGVKGFWNLELAVAGDVLIPRPETECLVEAALALLPAREKTDASGKAGRVLRVLEVGTGSGAVVLSLASENPAHQYFASDISVQAVAIARDNAIRYNLHRDIHFFSGDWFQPLSRPGRPFDIILSNPPYIPSREINRLQPEIHRYEPELALNGGHDGLDCLRHIIHTAHDYLDRRGYLLLEIDHDQKAGVRQIIAQCGHYEMVEFFKDYGGFDRVVQMRKK